MAVVVTTRIIEIIIMLPPVVVQAGTSTLRISVGGTIPTRPRRRQQATTTIHRHHLPSSALLGYKSKIASLMNCFIPQRTIRHHLRPNSRLTVSNTNTTNIQEQIIIAMVRNSNNNNSTTTKNKNSNNKSDLASVSPSDPWENTFLYIFHPNLKS